MHLLGFLHWEQILYHHAIMQQWQNGNLLWVIYVIHVQNSCLVPNLWADMFYEIKIFHSISVSLAFYLSDLYSFLCNKLINILARFFFLLILFAFLLWLLTDIYSLQGWFSCWQKAEETHQASPSGTSNLSTIMRWVFLESIIGDKVWQFHIRQRCTTQSLLMRMKRHTQESFLWL